MNTILLLKIGIDIYIYNGGNFYIAIKTKRIYLSDGLWQLLNHHMAALTTYTFGHVCQTAY